MSEGKVWGPVTTIMNAVAVTTGTDSSVVDCIEKPVETINRNAVKTHVTVYGDFPGGPTDDLDVYIYASIDGIVFDLTPLFSQRLLKSPDPNQISFVVKGVPYFKVHAKRSGATDTITTTIKARTLYE